MADESAAQPVFCLILGKNTTLHRRDDARSAPGKNWSACSWPPSDECRVVPLAVARVKYADHVPCDECFPGRVLPIEG